MRHRFTRLAVVCVWMATIYFWTGTSESAEAAAGARRNEKRETRKQAQQAQPVRPTHVDEKYGEHPKQALDLYLVKSEKATPLFIWIHGGGFRGGDKRA